MSELVARVAGGIGAIAPEDWDACAGADNPFLSHAFLSALEDSGSAVARAGWQAVPIVVDGADGKPAGIVPAYAKSHSQGEYVFDHGWADAWSQAGGSYYPKLQIAVPFTPVPGPRLLLRDPAVAPALIAATETMVAEHDLSSAHATFVTPEQLPLFEAADWLIRTGSQFHWHNEGYATFDDFLAALSSRKRKAIRKEREGALSQVEVRTLSGAEIGEAEWDAFWHFYQDTGSRKWGRPYLTRAFFTMLSERMADHVLLMLAYRDGRPVAGALNSDRRRYAVRPLLGLHGGHPVPPFRALLLSGDRGGDRARAETGRGGRAGRTQARARLSAGADLFGALHPASGLSPRGRGFPDAGASRGRARDRDARPDGAVQEGRLTFIHRSS